MSFFRRVYLYFKKKYVFFCVNKIYAGTNIKTFNKKRKLLNSIGYKIGENTKIVGPITITSDLEIGKNCFIGTDFRCYGNGKITIGDNCDIAPMVVMSTGSHDIGSNIRRAGNGNNKNIIIGSGTWIGIRSTILSNVVIGSGNIIADGSLVRNNTDNDLLIAGVPAEIKKILNDKG